MKPTDLFYVTQNHKIQVQDEIGRSVTDSIAEKIVKGSYKINSIANEMFCRSDFERLDYKYKQSMPKRSKFIYGKKLMERWKKNNTEFCRLIYNDELSVVDRFGCKIELSPLFYFLHVIPNCADDQILLLTDVEKFERYIPDLRAAKKAITPDILELMQKSVHEIDRIYSAMKRVGFSSKITDLENELQAAAIKQFNVKPDRFSYIKEIFLEDTVIYELTIGQPKRYFYGNMFRLIVEDQGLGKHGGQKLYKEFRRNLNLNSN
jgi:hypothetical protein